MSARQHLIFTAYLDVENRMAVFVGIFLLAATTLLAAVCLPRGLKRRTAFAAGGMIGVFGLILLGFQSAIVKPDRPPAKIGSAPQTETVRVQSLRPIATPSEQYVGAAQCRDCHPRNHATWWKSYHRTMTQLPTPQSVIGSFDDVHVSVSGRTYELRQRDQRFWVQMDNPDADSAKDRRLDRPIVLTTGSHHMQVYWYPTGQSRTLGQLPLVYLREAHRWIPRAAAFLQPPDSAFSSETGRWNETCSSCHTTFPRPRPLTDNHWDTVVAEFGISCEACHGPGEEHLEWQRAAAKDNSISGDQTTDPIMNPATLAQRRGSQVCGRCHSVAMPHDYDRTLSSGSPYRPGDDLSQSMFILRVDERTKQFLKTLIASDIDEHLAESFWSDGMV